MRSAASARLTAYTKMLRDVRSARPPASVEADMSVSIRVLAPAVTGEQRCHFLVQWRDSHAIQYGRTFTTRQEAAEFDAADIDNLTLLRHRGQTGTVGRCPLGCDRHLGLAPPPRAIFHHLLRFSQEIG
jgi:hypothetical protein